MQGQMEEQGKSKNKTKQATDSNNETDKTFITPLWAATHCMQWA
jgi:hypothetical protein